MLLLILYYQYPKHNDQTNKAIRVTTDEQGMQKDALIELVLSSLRKNKRNFQ